MQIEHIEKANEILEKIKAQERAIELLESGEQVRTTVTKEMPYSAVSLISEEVIEFEDWEIRLIVHQKKQRIEALKKELEAI